MAAHDFVKYINITGVLRDADRFQQRIRSLLDRLVAADILAKMGHNGDAPLWRLTGNTLHSVRPLIDFWVLIKKPGEGGCGDCLRRTSPGFPVLNGAQFGWESCCNQDSDGLCLTQTVALPPSLEAQDDGSDGFSRNGHLRLSLCGEKFL